MSIFSHITIGVNDLQRSIRFYDAVLSTLFLARHSEGESFAGFGIIPEKGQKPDNTGANSLWILKPANGEAATGGNGTNIALLAKTRHQVNTFFAKAIELGAISDGAPGIRSDAHDNFYACYVIDFDGNKIAVVCHKPE